MILRRVFRTSEGAFLDNNTCLNFSLKFSTFNRFGIRLPIIKNKKIACWRWKFAAKTAPLIAGFDVFNNLHISCRKNYSRPRQLVNSLSIPIQNDAEIPQKSRRMSENAPRAANFARTTPTRQLQTRQLRTRQPRQTA